MFADRQPAAPSRTERRGKGHAGSVQRVAAGRSRLPRLWRGRDDSEMAEGSVGRSRSVGGCASHPASRRHGQSDQSTARSPGRRVGGRRIGGLRSVG